MRLFTVLVLFHVLLIASPALALGDEMDSEHQTSGYGRMFAYICGAASALGVVLVGWHIIKGMIAENQRGKKAGSMIEEVLDEAPKKKRRELFLGEKVPDWKIDNRLKATKAALRFLSSTDDWFDKKYMANVAIEAMGKVKTALEERVAKMIERRVTAECLEELQTEIKRLRKKGELHIFDEIEVTGVDVVHFEAPAGKTKQTFTALISAKSKDYYKYEKNGQVFRGDKKVYSYQEFWRFRRTKERWLVERIRPSGDMDMVLNAKNVMAATELEEFAKDADPEYLREFVGK